MYFQDNSQNSIDPRQYYATHGIMTDPGRHQSLYDALPSEIPELCAAVRGLLVHVFHAHLHGLELSEQRTKEVGIRKVEDMLERMIELDSSPIDTPREPGKRLVGNCRNYAVLMCSFLRHKGIPSRARPGFATYFLPGSYEDHWICEYWNQVAMRWVQVDAQLDSAQNKYLKIDFDPMDLPQGKFLYAGTVYRMCAKKEIDPDMCGIHDLRGLWFVRGNVFRDLMALNKMEVLPWDETELMDEAKHPPQETATLLETIVDLTISETGRLSEIRTLYQTHRGLRMPAGWVP